MSVRLTTDPDRAVEVLAAGGVVAIPTETVYGLAADATQPSAVARVFAIKGRPADHPLIVHLAEAEDLGRWSADLPLSATRLTSLAWPGPLSVIVPRGEGIPPIVTGGRPTMAVRCPAHDVARQVIRSLGHPVAAPSANRFGRVSPTTAQHVAADLGNDVDLILDGGPCAIGVESTIVDCTCDPPQVLRPGGLPTEQIQELLQMPVDPPSGPSRAPGMLAVHYAPRCRVHVVDDLPGAGVLRRSLSSASASIEVLDLRDDVVAAARGLYSSLRHADERAVSDLIVIQPEPVGLGVAIRDRLSRAAAAH